MKGDNPFASGGVGRAMRSVRSAAKKAAAPPPAAAPVKKKGIAITQIDGPDGEIVHMEQGERYSHGDAKTERAKVTIRHGAAPKKTGKSDHPVDVDENRTEIHLKPHQLTGLKVGDKVSIHLKKHC